MHSSIYVSNVDHEAVRARIALKLGRLLSFLSRNAFLLKKNPDIDDIRIDIFDYLNWDNSTNQKCVERISKIYIFGV